MTTEYQLWLLYNNAWILKGFYPNVPTARNNIPKESGLVDYKIIEVIGYR